MDRYLRNSLWCFLLAPLSPHSVTAGGPSVLVDQASQEVISGYIITAGTDSIQTRTSKPMTAQTNAKTDRENIEYPCLDSRKAYSSLVSMEKCRFLRGFPARFGVFFRRFVFLCLPCFCYGQLIWGRIKGGNGCTKAPKRGGRRRGTKSPYGRWQRRNWTVDRRGMSHSRRWSRESVYIRYTLAREKGHLFWLIKLGLCSCTLWFVGSFYII